MTQAQTKAIAHIRSFNRFYTHILGLLDQHILDSDFSLTEARVLLEISKSDHCKANALGERLQIDPSYLSRIIRRLEDKALVTKTPAPADNRFNDLGLTAEGRQVLTDLDGRSEAQILSLIQTLSPEELTAVQDAMSLIRGKLSHAVFPAVIRGYREGDADYIIQRHMALYLTEYGLSETFGAYVESLVRRFTQNLDPACECVLIPEIGVQRMGSIAIAKADAQTAQLRYFLLEPEARGYGLGIQLVEAALAFARKIGYKRIFLETLSILTTARTIYKRMGFEITHTHPHADWGREVLEERWELDL